MPVARARNFKDSFIAFVPHPVLHHFRIILIWCKKQAAFYTKRQKYEIWCKTRLYLSRSTKLRLIDQIFKERSESLIRIFEGDVHWDLLDPDEVDHGYECVSQEKIYD